MPLPAASQDWPPKQLATISAKQAEWDAWYVGDPGTLASVYSTSAGRPVFDKVSQLRGGVVGAVARFWWGRPVGDLTKRDDDRLHVPIASDLCQASADLLFAEPPTIASTDKPVQAELDQAIERGLITTLSEGSEIGAALGDVYLRTTWDDQVADRSFITAVHADAAWPEFRWGRLVAVTFWWTVRVDGQKILRHLERHELEGSGRDAVGVIFHGLYEGTADSLGRLVPLTEDPSTKGLKVDADSKISTKSPGLAVVHVPNQLPQRIWRKDPVGRNLGRSDLAGVEGPMDKLDMTYSSWMRDVRLAKSRLIVPSYMLETGGPGKGVFFDADQDVFTTVNAPPREDGKGEITPQQFLIRTEDHLKTAQDLIAMILRTSGYSKQTFGEGEDGGAITATEVAAKDRRSNLTRDRKIRNLQPALVAIMRKKLAVDNALFKAGVNADADLTVDFGDTTSADPEALARTTMALFQAQSASVQTRVRILHPDWDENQIKTEAAAVLKEFSVSVSDPTEFEPDGPDPDVEPGESDAGES